MKKKIIMLPSEKPIELWDLITHKTEANRLGISKCSPKKSDGTDHHDLHNWTKANLYILSDEEIKREDWYLMDMKYPIQSASGEVEKGDYNNCKKIIGTTDTRLLSIGDKAIVDYTFKDGIFKIPQHIIEAYVKAYNKGIPFDEVEVEYEDITNDMLDRFIFSTIGGVHLGVNYPDEHDSVMGYYESKDEAREELRKWFEKHTIPKPKLNQDGTLAVSLVEEKKVWAKNVSTIHHGKQWTPYTKYGAIVFGEVAGEMKTFKTKEECEEWIKENL